jgi:hypothetical protein
MADTTIRVFLGIATESDLAGATVVDGDYRNYKISELPTSFVKVADITDFPELIGDTEDIESTTMSDTQRTYESGLQGTPTDSFTAQFDRVQYEAIQDLVNKGRNRKYRFCLLISDSQSVFDWVGSINVGLGGGGINEIISMPINITFATSVRLRKGYNGTYSDEDGKITIKPITA